MTGRYTPDDGGYYVEHGSDDDAVFTVLAEGGVHAANPDDVRTTKCGLGIGMGTWDGRFAPLSDVTCAPCRVAWGES